MHLTQLLRPISPQQNFLGFGPADWLELALAVILIGAALLRMDVSRLWPQLKKRRTVSWVLGLMGITIALRLALLPHCPIPIPSSSDDFSYLLTADTVRHFRLANPPHALSEFFETIFVLQRPTYSSIFSIGQGIAMAAGRLVFGDPWAGVLLAVSAFCGLSYWMLRGWVAHNWALVGGILSVIQFGPLNQWMNTYWGGALSAIAGCLVFGALPRLRESEQGRSRNAVLLGVGLGMELITRPFEFVLLVLSVGIYIWVALRSRRILKHLGIAALAFLPAACLTLLHNRAVTGNWTTLPYVLSRYQYGVPTTFTFQPNPAPHNTLTREQEMDYRAQSIIHGDGTETLGACVERLLFRIRFLRFFLLPPLYIPLIVFVATVREFRFAWIVGTVAIFGLGTNSYPYFYPHYLAALTCLFLLIAVVGLERMSRWTVRRREAGGSAVLLILALCAAHFLFWYGLHAFAGESLWPWMRYETWDYIDYGDPEGRVYVRNALTRAPGKQLVFVRYSPQHRFREWIHNDANIDDARIVWVHDLGHDENQKVLHYYRDRTPWLLQPDSMPPRLNWYIPGLE